MGKNGDQFGQKRERERRSSVMMMIRPKCGTKFTISVRVPTNPQDIELQTPKWMHCIIQKALKICREGMTCMETIDNGGCSLLKAKAKILCNGNQETGTW